MSMLNRRDCAFSDSMVHSLCFDGAVTTSTVGSSEFDDRIEESN